MGTSRKRLMMASMMVFLASSVVERSEAGLVLNRGDILVANGFGQNILRINPVTGEQAVLSSGGKLVRPLGIAVSPQGRIFVVDEDYDDGAVIEIDPLTGSQSVVSLALNRQPSGIALDDDGNLYVSEQLRNHRTVRIDPSTGGVTASYGGALFDRPMLPAVQGPTLIVPNRGNGKVVRIDLETGAQQLIATLGQPHAAAIDGNGDYLISDGPLLYRIERDSLAVSVLARNFGSLTGLAVASDGSVIAADRGTTKRLWAVDPATGAKSAISSDGLLVEPFQVAVYLTPVPEPSTLLGVLIGGGLLLAASRSRSGRSSLTTLVSR